MMPNQAYLEIVRPDGGVQFHPLDPGKGVITIGRHADNDVVINHPGVQPFHAVLDRRASPPQIIFLSQGEETRPGTALATGGTGAWDACAIAGHMLILFDADHAGAQPGLAAVPPAPCPADAPGLPPAAVPPRRRSLPARFHCASLVGPGLRALAAAGALILIGLMLQQIVAQATTDARQAERGETKRASLARAGARRASEAATPVALANQANNMEEMTYEVMFKEIAQGYALDWRMLAEQAYQESHLDPLALGGEREIGLMQILPSTWNEWAPKVGVTDPWDPYSNVLVAAAYLSYLKGYCADMGYPGDECMLVAYNWGPHNLRQLVDSGGDWGQVPGKTRHYAYAVLLATEVEAAHRLAGLSTSSRQVAVR